MIDNEEGITGFVFFFFLVFFLPFILFGEIQCISSHCNARNEAWFDKFPDARFKKLDGNV